MMAFPGELSWALGGHRALGVLTALGGCRVCCLSVPAQESLVGVWFSNASPCHSP